MGFKIKNKSKLIFFFTIIIALCLAIILIFKELLKIDEIISQKIISFWGGPIDFFFIFMGRYLGWFLGIIVLFLIIVLYLKKRKLESFMVLISLIFGYLISSLLKLVIQRTRPIPQLLVEFGYSFPSAHATFAFIVFSSLIYLYRNKIKKKPLQILFTYANLFLVLFCGFSRMYINVHWFTDILGGYLLGFFIIKIVLSTKKRVSS